MQLVSVEYMTALYAQYCSELYGPVWYSPVMYNPYGVDQIDYIDCIV